MGGRAAGGAAGGRVGPRPLITFLMLHGHLQPGYDYLLERKFSSLWRELDGSPLGADLERFLDRRGQLGFSERVRLATASQAPPGCSSRPGGRLDQLDVADLDEFAAACRDREQRTGKGWHHYRPRSASPTGCCSTCGILTSRRRTPAGSRSQLRERMAGITPRDRGRTDRLPGTARRRPARPRPSPAWPPG